MPTTQQLQTLDKYVDVIHELLIDQINGIRAYGNRQIIAKRTIFNTRKQRIELLLQNNE